MARLAELLSECQDTVDHVTLEEFSAFAPSELVLLEMPAPRRDGHRYRCFVRSSLLDWAVSTHNHMSAEEEGGFVRLVTSTYLPGLDFEHRDLEFLVRTLERPPLDGPVVLHVARIVEVPASRVYGSQGVAAHIHELAEAHWERQLWSLFDRAVMPTTTTCPAGHPLRQQPRPGRGALDTFTVVVICDNCERTLAGMERYRCTRNCDFDLCQDCYGHGDRADEHDRAAWLRQRLREFWGEHQDFVLPSSPPRLDPRSKRLSPAVTKWNSFTLTAQDVLGLREQFLADLVVHGMDTSCLRPEFWPGCAVQCERAERYVRRSLKGRTGHGFSDKALQPHARQLAPQLGPAWSEDLALELLAAVLVGRGSRDPEQARAAALGGFWRYLSNLWPVAAIIGNRLARPLAQAVFRAPWWHLSAVAAGVLLCAALSSA